MEAHAQLLIESSSERINREIMMPQFMKAKLIVSDVDIFAKESFSKNVEYPNAMDDHDSLRRQTALITISYKPYSI